MERFKQCMRFFFLQHLLSYKMLSASILSFICIDIYIRPLRRFCLEHNIKLNLFGMPILWNKRYIPAIIMLIFIFAITGFPLDRRRHQYYVARLGTRNWLQFQSLYLIIFSGIYILWNYVVCILTLLPCGTFTGAYYDGWWNVGILAVRESTDVGISIPQEYFLTHETIQANIEFIACVWLVMILFCMIVLLFNQLKPYLGDIIGAFVILSGLSNKITGRRTWVSPMHFIGISNRYSALHPENPQYIYMIIILVLVNLLLYFLAESWICNTQENNRRVE